MSRDDSFMYTGQTSSSMLSPVQREVDEKRNEAKLERERLKLQLATESETITDAFDKELADLHDISVDDTLPPEQYKNEALLNRRVIEAVEQIKKNVLGKLR